MDNSTQIHIDPAYGWHTRDTGPWIIRARSPSENFVQNLSDTLKDNISAETLSAFLKNQDNFSGGIAQHKQSKTVIAWADHIRSFPVYYSQKDSTFFIGNNARQIQTAAGCKQSNNDSILEFLTAGYATGPHTLYKNLNVLQPGEILLQKNDNTTPKVQRYYRYMPRPESGADWNKNRDRLGQTLDTITQKIIARAGGRPLWIPLSAGLDSRIILCKLHEHGYKNIRTFTYGPAMNFESLNARNIAQTLGVPWQAITPSRRWIKDQYKSPWRKAYWDYADGLKAVPCMREFSAITWLHDVQKIDPNGIFLNGLSGDFITGGHVPARAIHDDTYDQAALLEDIINKHYDLWRPAKTEANKQNLAARILENLADCDGEIAAKMEAWEYEARQVCYSIGSQRLYEFFGFGWELPLWERALVDFCETLPWEQKQGQALYKDYLRHYNYKGLFPDKEPYIWRWPAPMLWVLPAAKIIGLLGGTRKKADFYALMRYFGHYANQYACFDWKAHRKTYKNARNIVSLFVLSWLAENNLEALKELGNRYDIDWH